MIRRRGIKIFKKLINVKYLPILAVFLILCLSVGFSAFEETLLIEDTVANVLLIQDAKITAAQIEALSNNTQSNYVEIDENTLSGSVVLPESTSTVTYKVEVKNLENVEVGILDIESDNNDIEVTSTGNYTLGSKICDDTTPSKCTLGATKNLYITIGYGENAYDVQTKDENKEFTLEFDVEDFVSVTYVNISGSGYPSEVINGGTLEVDFDTNAPASVSITMDSVALTNQEYTYTNGVLTIPIVDGDVVISGPPATICRAVSSSTAGNVPTGQYNLGDEYICRVNGNQEFNFFILSKDTQNQTVNLIMNRNIKANGTVAGNNEGYTAAMTVNDYDDVVCTSDVDPNNPDQCRLPDNQNNGISNRANIEVEPLISSNSKFAIGVSRLIETLEYGPQTAMRYLKNATSTWTNISSLNISHTVHDVMFGTAFLHFHEEKARLPYTSEIIAAGCEKYYTYYVDEGKYMEPVDRPENKHSCPLWLVDYLYNGGSVTYTNRNSINQQGYWIEQNMFEYSGDPNYLINYIDRPEDEAMGISENQYNHVVDLNGGINCYDATEDSTYGVRPVITVSFSDLS